MITRKILNLIAVILMLSSSVAIAVTKVIGCLYNYYTNIIVWRILVLHKIRTQNKRMQSGAAELGR